MCFFFLMSVRSKSNTYTKRINSFASTPTRFFVSSPGVPTLDSPLRRKILSVQFPHNEHLNEKFRPNERKIETHNSTKALLLKRHCFPLWQTPTPNFPFTLSESSASKYDSSLSFLAAPWPSMVSRSVSPLRLIQPPLHNSNPPLPYQPVPTF